jgi:glycerol-3-phosphate dehydrogenase (NAD(P)+)
MDVGVLGGGPWGKALALAARRAGNHVVLCTRREHDDDLGDIQLTPRLDELARCRLLLLAVPSNQVRWVAHQLGDHVDGSHLLVHGVRGLSAKRLNTISQILRDETPTRRVGALGGPVQADELTQNQHTVVMVGSRYSEVRRAVNAALRSPCLLVYETDDLKGLEWASALVGCLSIVLGFVQGAKATPGLLAALISRGVDEAALIAAAAGADKQTLYGLAGYGDLLASLALPQRPEMVLGRGLAAGLELAEAQQKAQLRVEAIDLIPRIVRFANEHHLRCDVFEALVGILEGHSAADIVGRLFDIA